MGFSWVDGPMVRPLVDESSERRCGSGNWPLQTGVGSKTGPMRFTRTGPGTVTPLISAVLIQSIAAYWTRTNESPAFAEEIPFPPRPGFDGKRPLAALVVPAIAQEHLAARSQPGPHHDGGSRLDKTRLLVVLGRLDLQGDPLGMAFIGIEGNRRERAEGGNRPAAPDVGHLAHVVGPAAVAASRR